MKLAIGTYSKDTNSDGIYIFDFEDGKLLNKKTIQNKNNPSWLTVIKDKNLLVANEELDGVVSLTTYDLETFEEKQRVVVKEQGFGSCHSIYEDNKLHVSNYGSGNFLTFDVNEEITINPEQREYTIADDNHCHQIVSSSEYFVVIELEDDYFIPCDKNLIDIYFIKTRYKDGPRHGVFSKDEKYFYLLTELSNKLYTYDVEEEFELVSEISTLDKDFKGTSYGAEIVLSEDGKTLYCSNRGEDTIVEFTLLGGIPNFKTRFSSCGKHPRSFTIKDNYLIVANKDSDNVVVIDLETKEKISETKVISPTFVGLI